MKKLFLSFILIFGISLAGLSQDTVTIYLDNNFMATEIENARFIRKAIIENDHYYITDTDIDGKMVSYGEYNSINPWIEDGLSIHYDLNGEKYSSGNYLNGNLIGKWNYYTYGKIDKVNYDIDLTEFHVDFQNTNEVRKKKKLMQKEDIHTEAITSFFNKNFRFPARAKSKSDNFNQIINLVVDIDGKIKSPEIVNFIDADLSLEIFRILLQYRSEIEIIAPIPLSFAINYNFFDENTIFTIVENMPEFTYRNCSNTNECINQFISDSLRIPDKECIGRVMVNFVVETDGSISNLQMITSIANCLGYEQEIERLFKNMPKWVPGSQRGKIVRVMQHAHVNFKN